MDKREKVLIIDDDEMLGECLRDLLQLNGFEASYCNGGQSALALSQATRFNVIITDYQMPGLDGLEVTRSMRTRYPESFIVGLSANPKEPEFLRAGANAFFKKPCQFHELVAMIKEEGRERREPNIDNHLL